LPAESARLVDFACWLALAVIGAGEIKRPQKETMASKRGLRNRRGPRQDADSDDLEVVFENVSKVRQKLHQGKKRKIEEASETTAKVARELSHVEEAVETSANEYTLDAARYLIAYEQRLLTGWTSSPTNGLSHADDGHGKCPVTGSTSASAVHRGPRFQRRSPQASWRKSLVEWMSTVVKPPKLNLNQSTLHLSVVDAYVVTFKKPSNPYLKHLYESFFNEQALLDGFMDNHFIAEGKLRFVAMVALRLAAKMEDTESQVKIYTHFAFSLSIMR
jgi:hypothetical protein